MAKKEKKSKKPKVIYIDDGRTIADMSALSGGRAKAPRSSSSFRDIWQTYWDATRMMLLPMLVMIGFLTVLFLLAALLFWLL